MSGISTADGLSAVDGGGSSAITIGTTTITGGTGGRVLYETSGNVVGEISGATSNGTALTLVAPVLGTPASGTLTNCTGYPVANIANLGTGVATALAVNVGSAGALVAQNGALGTPSSGTLTSATGLPVATGISGLGTGVATWLATPSSSNLAGALTDETGTGACVFAGSPTFTGTPNLATAVADSYKLSSSGIITDSSTARTLSAGDNGTVLYFTSASAITLSMASSLGAGFSCTVLQGAAGQITFAANSQTMTVAGGLTKTAYVGATALILEPAANVFFISGTLA